MNIERFRQIISYSDANRNAMEDKIRDFYAKIQMENGKELLNLIQIVRPLFTRKGYIIVEMPFSDKEIGALCYKGDLIGYTFLNTSLPKVNVNFAFCHEIYHVFYQETEFKSKVELMNEHYYEYEDESAANLFAGMLLMPEASFRFMYNKFKSETDGGNELCILAKLMNYFEAPYMAALIRCYELELLEQGEMLEKLICVDTDSIREMFVELWLDDNILNATKKDDYNKFEIFVKCIGEQYIDGEYINRRTLEQTLHNMRTLYEQIRG